MGQTQTLSGLGGEIVSPFATRLFELGNGECNTGEQTDLHCARSLRSQMPAPGAGQDCKDPIDQSQKVHGEQ